MKTKHLFLTLMMLLASATLSWSRTVTDVITPNLSTGSFTVLDEEGGASLSGVSYEGLLATVGTETDYDFMQFGSGSYFCTNASDGICAEIRVEFLYDDQQNTLSVFGRDNTPYSSTNKPGRSDVGYKLQPEAGYVALRSDIHPKYLYFNGQGTAKVLYIKITWDVPEEATEVTFIAEHAGAYYAVGHSLDANGLEAVKVQVVDGKVVLPNGVAKADLTWYRRSSGFDATAHTFQNSSSGKFLTINGSSQISLLDAEGLYSPSYVKNGVYSWANCALVYDADVNRFVAGAGATAAQGAAVQYVNSSTTFESYNASKHAFTRTFNGTNISAICLPYTIAAADLQDVNVYTLEGKTVDAEGNLTGISLLEKEDGMQAGVPYIIRAKSASKTTIVFPYGGNKSTEKGIVEVGGIVGNLGATVVISTSEDDDIYFLSSNRLKHLVDGTFTLGTNKCYLHMENLDPIAPVQAPGRIFLNTDEYQQPNTATNVEDVEAKNLNWNEPVYNLMGQRVAEGATGVLIQNGKKFMIY